MRPNCASEQLASETPVICFANPLRRVARKSQQTAIHYVYQELILHIFPTCLLARLCIENKRTRFLTQKLNYHLKLACFAKKKLTILQLKE